MSRIGAPGPWRGALPAGLVYFACAFAAGFLLGAIRVPVLEPWLGPAWAVALEMPVLLALLAFAARRLPRRFGIADRPAALLAMGGVALLLLLAADAAFGWLVRGMGAQAQLRRFATPEGAIYALALVAFAALPWLVRDRGARRA